MLEPLLPSVFEETSPTAPVAAECETEEADDAAIDKKAYDAANAKELKEGRCVSS